MARSNYFQSILNTIVVTSLFTPAVPVAQVLEEIIVTAQRREQDLQEVPISLEVFTGDVIELQGFRNMDDMSRFSPSVSVMDGSQNQITTIRGFGTGGNALNLQSATPTFVDGIAYGQTSMIKTAYLDSAQVEILKGPQPLHFGLNATAGAFNIISRRPTPEWTGNVAVEVASYDKREVDAAISGPLSDTLRLRVAGIAEEGDGPVKNRVTREPMSKFDHMGGRIMLEWLPTENLNVLSKFEYSRQRNGGELTTGCLSEGPGRRLAGFPKFGPIDGGVVETADFGNQRSVWDQPPNGITGGEGLGIVQMEPGLGEDCFRGEYGISREGPYLTPLPNVVGEHSATIFDGMIDIRAATEKLLSNPGPNGEQSERGVQAYGADGKDYSNSWTALLDVNYELANGININSQTGYVHYWRLLNRENSESPFLYNYSSRQTDLYQVSQQVRVESQAEGYDLNLGIPGDVNLDFMFGGFYQAHDSDMISVSPRGILNQGLRINDTWEDSTWKSAFWNLTFNLWDDQLAFSAGGRYTDIHTENYHHGVGSQWIFDEVPCNSVGTDANPATCTVDPDFKRVHPNLTTYTVIDPVTGRGGPGTPGYTPARESRVDSPNILFSDVNLNNLWTPNLWNRTTDVPLNYRSGMNPAVGYTAGVGANTNGPFGTCDICVADPTLDSSNYDNQFVLSYTPTGLNSDHTFYAKYTEAFKGAFSQHGQGSIAATLEELVFEPEYATQYELGVRGTLLDSRIQYDATVFTLDFKDMQTAAAAARFNPQDRDTVSLNAQQTTDGAEFRFLMAVTPYLTFNLGGAVMDARFTEFETGCTEDELVASAAIAQVDPSVFDRYKDIDLPETLTINESTTPVNENRLAAIAFKDFMLNQIGPTRAAVVTGIARSGEMLEDFYRNGGCRLAQEEVTDELIGGGVTIGAAQTTDRAGQQPALVPDWKFVMGLNYTRPVMDRFEAFVDVVGFIADDELVESTTFDGAVRFDSGHGDMNISAGFGPEDGKWQVIAFVRSLLEDTLSYHPEGDMELKGHVTSENSGVSRSDFRSIGLQYKYDFF